METSSKKYSPFDFYISVDFDEIVDLYHGFTYIGDSRTENIDRLGQSKCSPITTVNPCSYERIKYRIQNRVCPWKCEA